MVLSNQNVFSFVNNHLVALYSVEKTISKEESFGSCVWNQMTKNRASELLPQQPLVIFRFIQGE